MNNPGRKKGRTLEGRKEGKKNPGRKGRKEDSWKEGRKKEPWKEEKKGIAYHTALVLYGVTYGEKKRRRLRKRRMVKDNITYLG